jgi:LEA14-like dessication related protein
MAFFRRLISIWGAALLLGACSSWLSRPDPPLVSLADIDIVDLGLIEQRLGLQLRMQNPNRFALPVQGMDFVLELNDHDFAHGVSDEPVTIPAYGEALIRVDVVSNAARIFEQLRDLAAGDRETFRYQLSGGVGLAGFSGTIPFESGGEISLAPRRSGEAAEP